MKFYIGYTPWGSESYQRFADILLGANNVLYAYTVGSDNDGGTAVSGLLSRRHYLSDYCQSWVWSQWGSSSDSAMIEVRGGDSTANTFVALRTQDTDRLKIDRAGKLWLYDGPIEIDISGGDPIIIFDTASSDRFTLGVDASDSYKFKISDGSSLGSNDWFIIDSSGNVEIDESLTVNGATEITASLSDVSYSPGLRLLNTNTGSGTGPSHSPGILFENSSSSYSDYASCIYGYGNAIYLKMTSNGWTSAGALASFSDTLITLEHDTKVWGDLEVVGALSKGSGSFKIDHPLTHLKETHYLVHSFLESPGADLVYSGMIQLQNGKAAVNIEMVHLKSYAGTYAAFAVMRLVLYQYEVILKGIFYI